MIRIRPVQTFALTALALTLFGLYNNTLAQAPAASPAATQTAPSAPANPAPAGGAPAAPTAAPAAPGQGPAPVEVTKVTIATVVDDVSATGTVKSNESVMLRPEIIGRVAKLNFRDGEKVCRGQILVELDTSLQKANKDQATAELNLTIANFKRNEELFNQKFISSSAKDNAESQVQVAKAKLDLTEAQLQRGFIRAPFTGLVGLRNVSVGEYVKDGTDLVTLDDLSRIRVDFKLPERYAAQAKMGQKVLLEPDAALRIKDLTGKVDAIDTVLDTNGRSLTLRTRTANPRGVLKPGMFIKTKLILSERKGALMVPDESVIAQGRDMIVYKVVDSKAVRTIVKTGVRQLGKIEIKEGLLEGELIVQAGLIRINRDGQPVKVIEPRAPAAGAGGPGGVGSSSGAVAPQGGAAGGPAGGAVTGAAKPSDAKPAAGGKPPAGKGKPPVSTEKVCDDELGRAGSGGAGSANSGGTNSGGGRPAGGGQGPRPASKPASLMDDSVIKSAATNS